ncbi:Fpg/Nei family DNA glycosylase [Schumannella luteola]|uniref:Formamidopyrimidine-DNA glycosylase n=1 Tax=Schumannella luteola TaxID=472059 RepID=A0A852YEY3_9MICO|nr:DNA-formamidopyrimidine glycosylase family protein [Schumannella luteola]NYG99711.1 formamidopyrimidine-DNA glycosylase [Schumannella luteola]TPX06493.1 Fpg/Nei family DNA glycosylase [Schumannella luteola]
MPELPEVHALATDLGRRMGGRTVERMSVLAFPALKTFDPPVEALSGRQVTRVDRHGKFLDLVLEHPAGGTEDKADSSAGAPLHLILHLARAGWIRWRADVPKPVTKPGRSPIAARLVLDDGSGFDVTEAGTKKSLAIHVVRSPEEVPGIARLGPDPMADDFDEERFAAILATRGREQIKGVLRNQSVFAGIGNAYSDEILHTARMSPFAPASMPAEKVQVLFAALRSTLNDALERADGLAASELKSEKRSGMQVHGRTGEPCPVCGDTVRQVIYSDSTFQYCPTCQTGGKPLADRVLSRLLK